MLLRMTAPALLISRDGPVLSLCLNRPESKNSLDPELVESLGDALEQANVDTEVRAVILTGAGGAFCSGVDLRQAAADIAAPERLEARLTGFHRLIFAITGCDKPVVAAVDGPAVGFGADLALACDLRVASSSAYFQEKFVALGLMPDGGGTFHLPRLIGVGRALEHLLLGTRIDAEAALGLGLVNRVVAPSELAAESHTLATQLAAGAPLAVAAIKRAVRQNLESDLASALMRERKGQLGLLASADVTEGVSAFFARRPARFQGK
jgi:enoyl-CoA hydratase/carnithine racemase